MRLSYCDISAKPQFQFLVTELTPKLGERTNHEVFKDYLEYGKLREASDILNKVTGDYFSPYKGVEITGGAQNEITMTKGAMAKELGYKSSLPTKLSGAQVTILKGNISRTNNALFKAGTDKVYRLEDVKQVGESDNFTYKLSVYQGTLDVDAKGQRKRNEALDNRRAPSPLNQESMDLEGTTPADFVQTQVVYAQEFIRKYADVLKEQTGVDHETITAAQAVELTKGTENPWNGQKAFFFAGKVYFTSDSLTPDDVLHEFIHPVVRGIAVQNSPLFNNLFTKLSATTEGGKIIEEVTQLYPHLSIKTDDFKEEVLVRALAEMQDLKSKNLENTPAFEKFISNLLYAIKQFLRKTFGTAIKVENLDENTTLQELATILQTGGKFELDTEAITDKDFVAYKNEYNQFLKDVSVEKIDQKEMEDLANKYFDAVKQYLYNAKKQKDLGELKDVLYNRFKTGELEKMAGNLKAYQTTIIEHAKEMEDEVELTRQRTLAIINSLGNLDNMVEKIVQGLKDVTKDIDNQDNIQRVLYYQNFLTYWAGFAKDAREKLGNQGVSVPMVDRIVSSVDRANGLVEDFYKKASKEAIWGLLKNTGAAIDQKWETHIADLKARKAPAAEIAAAETQAKTEKLTPGLIDQALNGQLKDMGWAHAYLESAGYSPDPLVGGLALLVKRAVTEYEAKAQAMFNDAATQLKPLMDRADFEAFDAENIGEKIGFKDKMGYVDPDTGEFQEREVWRMLNQFAGHDLAQDKYRFDIKKAGEKYKESHLEADRAALASLQAEYQQFLRDYFNQKYDDRFYKAYDILKGSPAGDEARRQMDLLYNELNELSSELFMASAENVLEISDLIEAKRREIKQLASLYDANGESKTGMALEIAVKIQAFNEAVKDLYDSVEVPRAFETAYQAYEKKLHDEGKRPGDGMYDKLMTEWLARNTRTVIKEEFWEKMDLLSQAIKDILATIPQQKEISEEIEEGYKTLKSLVRGNRDESGQPLGDEMTEEKQRKILEAQDKINKAREKLNKLSGLSKAEEDQINAIFARLGIPGNKITEKERLTLSRLLDKKAVLRLNKFQRAELGSLFAEMDELRSKEATDSYVDTVNGLLDNMGFEETSDIIPAAKIDKSTAYLLANDDLVQNLMSRSTEFAVWFERNHTARDTMDWQTMRSKIVWDRTYAWNVIKPNDPKYYESTSITNSAGETINLPTMPSMKFYKRLVKDEYRTKEVVGETVDNRGHWLPKTVTQGAKDDRFANKEHERLRVNDPAAFALLEKLKSIHLKNQEGLDNNAKLYLDFARYRKGFKERVQSDDVLQRFIQQIKDFFLKVKDGWDSGFNWDTNLQLTKLDLFDNDLPGVPISGISALDAEEVSTDVILSTMKYALAAERNKALTAIAPVARAVQKTVNNEKNHPFAQKMMGSRTLMYMNKKTSRYVRQKAVNNYIERVFEGEVNKGWGADNALVQNFSNFIFRRSAFAFLGLNIPSALKNYLGMRFQNLVEVSAGRYMNRADFLSSEMDATTTTMSAVTEIYKQGPKSLEFQLMEIFDPERDYFQYHYGTSLTRSVGRDYSFEILNRMNDFRKMTQMQAGLQTMYAMLRHEKITMNDGKKISYKDAWEVKDGKIQLKSGVPKEYGITYNDKGEQQIGEKFIAKRIQIQRVLDNLNGAMGQTERVEAERYLLFRYISFFRRFLTAMIMNRFAKSRYDYQLADRRQGFYITFLTLMYDTVRNMGQNLPYMTSDQKAASMRAMTEVGTVMLLKYVVLAGILGFDDDDEDRFKKLRANSDTLPFPGAVDDPTRIFKLSGWLKNHAILQTMQVAAENDQFIPIPNWGLKNYKDMFNIKSLAFGPTVNTYLDLLSDAYYIASDSEKARYKRQSGAYQWNQEGELKLWNHIGKMFGFTSSTIDPALAVRNYQNVQSR